MTDKPKKPHYPSYVWLVPDDTKTVRRHWMNSAHQDECPCISGDIFDTRCLCGYDAFEKVLLDNGIITKEHIDFKCGENVPEPKDWWSPGYDRSE